MTARRRWTIASIFVITVSVLMLGPPLRGQSGTSSIELISATPEGRPAGGQIAYTAFPYLYSRGPQKISADNRYVVFASETSQDSAGDTLSYIDIFVRDRQTRTTRVVSRPANGQLSTGGHSGFPVISANGRHVAFISNGYNFGPVDTNEIADVYVTDLVTNTTQLVSVTTSGVPSNVYPEWLAISADGRYIAFETRSTTIVPGDGNRLNSDIFLRDMVLGTTQRVSVRPDGSAIVGADSIRPSMSADGRRIAFTVTDNTSAGPTPQVAPNLDRGIYVRDLNTNQTIYVSEHPDGVPGRFHFQPIEPMISANGRYVSFASLDDLDPNFPDMALEALVDGPFTDVFVRDLQASTTSRVSLPFPDAPDEESGSAATISGDGRYVAYTNGGAKVRVRDRVAGTTTAIITAGVDGQPLDRGLDSVAISEDGQLVYFESSASNLVDPPDINVRNDSFVWRMGPSADLSLALSASTTQPAPNSNVTLTVGVTNNGPNDASGVVIRAPLPAGLTFVSATGSGYNAAAGTWTIGVLTTGSTATLQIEATYTISSAVTMTARVGAASPRDPDSTPDNNNAAEDDQQSVVLAPNVADLSLDLQTNVAQPPVGSNVTVTVSLTNSGPGTATGIVARMTLPAGLTFVSANPAAAYHAPSGYWTPAPLPSGTTVTLTVVARVTVATAIDVIAQVAGVDQVDPDSTPNNDVATEDDQDTVRLTPVATGIVVNDATMAVDGNDGLCTLVEAIVAANTDLPSGNAVGECAGGNGADTIHLRALNAPKDGANRDLYRVLTINNNDIGPTGLPAITTDITIDGGSAIIQRGGAAAFRLFVVDSIGRLTLNSVGVVGGLLTGTQPAERNGAGALNAGTLTLDNAYFASNQASANGGAVHSVGPLHVRTSTFEFNVASFGSGGAILAFHAGVVTIAGTTMRSNSAPAGSGGALMIHGTTTASIVDSVIDANSARIEAGGLLMHNADANVSIGNTRFTNNVVTDGSGGAISNGRVDGLTGGMVVLGGTMTITNSVVSNNRVTAGYGAGIANTGALTIATTTVSDNQMFNSRCGTGIYTTVGQAALNGATVTRNTGGGGVCAFGAGALTIVNSTISLNTNVGGFGGGVQLVGSSATITGSTIIGNEAVSAGGIHSFSLVTSTTVTVDSTLVQQNRATSTGGGIGITGGTTTLRNNTRLIDNTAGQSGGGLLAYVGNGPASVTMTGGAIEGNIANATSGGGGGIANFDSHAQSRLTLTDVAIRNNRAPNRDGGGIFNMGVLAVNGGELRGNTALSGAGLANGLSETTQGGPATLTNVTVEGNVASFFGGGIFNAANTVTVSGGTVRNNRAAIGGGIDNRATLLVDRTTLASNAAQEGGGIYSGAASTITTSTFSGNTALRGGGLRVAGGTTNLTRSTLSGNTATADGAGALDVGTPVVGGAAQGRANLSWSTIAANVGSIGGIRNAGVVQILTSILAANRRQDGTVSECTFDPGGIQYSFADNIIGEDPGCVLALQNRITENRTVDPSTVFTSLLGPLANNGGPTATHALLPGSLALDAIDVAICNTSNNTTDQRGEPPVADGDGDGTTRCDIGSFEQQVPLQGPIATLASLTPASVTAGAAAVTLTVNGVRFTAASVAYWNGSPRTTWVHSPTRMSVTIPASDLAGVADLRTAMVTVANPGAGVSNALPFTIVGSTVLAYQTQIVPPSTSSTISQLPTAFGQSGLSATMRNNTAGSSAAIVTVATYTTNPASGTIVAAGGIFDVQVLGADASDAIDIRYYYPSTVTGGVEASLQLQYWTGTSWLPVIGSGGAAPVKNTTDNLDGTISGGRVAVTLDATSTPTIMSLGGTIFALAPAGTDVDPPTTTATMNPPPNENGWNRTPVNVTLTAIDAVSAVAGVEYTLDGGTWTPYAAPIKIGSEGLHRLRFRARDAAGNVEPERTATVKIDKSDPGALAIAWPFILWPPHRQLVDVDVSVWAKDFLSGVAGFTLVSVTSNDSTQTADDFVGWTIGTPDTKGKLRAETSGRGRERIYSLTYEATDRAGNTERTTATVLVPARWW